MCEIWRTPINLRAGFAIILFMFTGALGPTSAFPQDTVQNSPPAIDAPPERIASLPTENTLDAALPPASIDVEYENSGHAQRSPGAFSQLKRFQPIVSADAEWLPAGGATGIASYGATVKVPTYPVFGPPPPLIQFGYNWTEFRASSEHELPDHVMDVSLGLSGVRRLNDRWTLRLMGSIAFASDGDNTSSDAWQFRGGAFGMYSRDPHWIWTVGVVVLGRNDLPAVPAVGLIWQPNDVFKLDLILPRPRISTLLLDGSSRQCWGYLGGGFSGGTWAYEHTNGQQDQLTYGDWRLVAGLESVPRVVPGIPFQRGRKLGLEIGYAFARDIEYESGRPTLSLDDTLLVQATLSF